MQHPPSDQNPDPRSASPRFARPCGTRPPCVQAQLRLFLLASDPVTGDSARAYLRQVPSICLLSAEQSSKAEAVLALASNVTGETLSSIERVVRDAAGNTPSVVLVADSISRPHLVRAISHGLISYLPRPETGMDRAVQALLAAREGRSDLPQTMIKALIEQVRSDGDDRSGKGPGAVGLTRREINVLSLIADGLSTAEIAQRLNYSEKTIKNILHAMTVRLGLRNRAHAVAYAVRAGIV